MNALIIALAVAAQGASQPASRDVPLEIAKAYLTALEGKGDQSARSYLLGGVPLAAESYTIPNWKIIEREPLRTEVGSIPSAKVAMKRLDSAGFSALQVAADSVSREKARMAVEKTKKASDRFTSEHPLFAYMARTGKEVYWHPKNPWRAVVKQLGNRGRYTLEMHLFRIEEREANRPPRAWPLRVLRIQGGGYDSGWKILPASAWDPDY